MIGETLILRDSRKERVVVYGETRLFWLCGCQGNPIRVKKSDLTYSQRKGRGKGRGRAYTLSGWKEACWLEESRFRLAQMIRNSGNRDFLRAVEKVTMMSNAEIENFLKGDEQ